MNKIYNNKIYTGIIKHFKAFSLGWLMVEDVAMKTPEYDALQKKANQVAYDFSLKRAIVEVDRDADRRWSFATDKMKLAEDKGEVGANSAPLEDAASAALHGRGPWLIG